MTGANDDKLVGQGAEFVVTLSDSDFAGFVLIDAFVNPGAKCCAGALFASSFLHFTFVVLVELQQVVVLCLRPEQRP